MPTKQELHARLDALNAKLTDARSELDFKHSLNDGHHLTSGELVARYLYLKEALDNDIAAAEAHGHRVGALEQDAMTWIESIDLNMA